MHPIVHPPVSYLVYAVALRAVGSDPPGDRATLALLVGAVLPDLIDQSLYHLAGFPTTRTIGHSLLLALPVCAVVVAAARRSSQPDAMGTAFTVGYLAHLAADALWPLVLGLFEELGFLLWPVTHMPAYEGTKDLFAVAGTTVTTLWVEVVLLAVAAAVWWRDGRPGLVVPDVE